MTIDYRLIDKMLSPNCKLSIHMDHGETKIIFQEVDGETYVLFRIDSIIYKVERKWFFFLIKTKYNDFIQFSMPWKDINLDEETKRKIWNSYSPGTEWKMGETICNESDLIKTTGEDK